ncbi:MAG TPA: hemin uptake protein HemP [Dongiaceae bacterium]|nr:hemin uptake protein HemP [Dongiaceae bacterium]
MNIQQSTVSGRILGQVNSNGANSSGASSNQAAGSAAGNDSADVPRFPSSKILGAAGEAVIEHDGHLYRLRRTSRGGLVLTK